MSNFSYSAFKTILSHEIKNYFRDFQWNILSPLVNTLLFIFIMSAIESYYSFVSNETSYIHFLIPGIIIMVVMQSSFNHLSEVIINMKQIGSFNDYLTSPISRIELFFSLLFSSIFVCLSIAFINIIVLLIFYNFNEINIFSSLYFLILTILIFASLGALTGFLSFTWDIQSAISNFFIIPISFLSGTFFSIDSINENWQFIFYYNPFYYLVSGFRNAFIENINLSYYNHLYIISVTTIFIGISIFIFKKGYKVIN